MLFLIIFWPMENPQKYEQEYVPKRKKKREDVLFTQVGLEFKFSRCGKLVFIPSWFFFYYLKPNLNNEKQTIITFIFKQHLYKINYCWYPSPPPPPSFPLLSVHLVIHSFLAAIFSIHQMYPSHPNQSPIVQVIDKKKKDQGFLYDEIRREK